ncbi:hypothetical protein ACIP9H_33840 [Streptomyces sp. NPDC088732]|uniref:hypothetical protein n=1 Tax=Streptomyces sp. NPDC088732 TaxID=3365879 RepID=UPI003823A78D
MNFEQYKRTRLHVRNLWTLLQYRLQEWLRRQSSRIRKRVQKHREDMIRAAFTGASHRAGDYALVLLVWWMTHR